MTVCSAPAGCRVLLETCAGVRPGETVVIVTDDSSRRIAEVLYEYSGERHDTTIVRMKDRSTHGENPSDAVWRAISHADVFFGVTRFSLFNTEARISACRNGARFVNMVDYSMDMLERGCLFVDFESRSRAVDRVASRLAGDTISITSPAGTDLRSVIRGRKPLALYGRSLDRGSCSSPPDIECSIGPVEGTSSGVLAIDGSIPLPELGLLHDVIHIEVADGMLKGIRGGEEADILKAKLGSFHDTRVYVVAEIGIGMNNAAALSGRMLEDEGACGTMHIGIGNNLSYGGTCDTNIHIDMIMKAPTCAVDGAVIVRNGEIIG